MVEEAGSRAAARPADARACRRRRRQRQFAAERAPARASTLSGRRSSRPARSRAVVCRSAEVEPLRPRRRARSRFAAPTSTVIVSKNAFDAAHKPSRRYPGRAAPRCVCDARAAAMARQPFRAVIDRVHRGHHRQQHLRGADVRGRLLAADMLLAGLQRQPVGRLPARIDRHADDPAGHRALERVPAPPCRRHAGRHSPSARRNAAPSRPRYRRPFRPATSAASAPAGSAATMASAPAGMQPRRSRP